MDIQQQGEIKKMIVHKKTLSEAITKGIDFINSANSMFAASSSPYKSFWEKCAALSSQTEGHISTLVFCHIIQSYIKCQAAKEVIYQAIELLGVEIV